MSATDIICTSCHAWPVVPGSAFCERCWADMDEDLVEGEPSSEFVTRDEGPETGSRPATNGVRPVADESGEERAHRETALEREQARLVPFDAMATRPPPEWLVDDLIVAGSSVVLYSPPAVGKSFVALDIAACVATGTWWHGRAVKQGPVLYVAAEGTGGLPVRVQAWKAHNRMAWVDGFDFLPGSTNLLDPAQAQTLAELTVAKGYRLVVIDTMARVTAGGDENSGKDMGTLVAAVAKLQAAGAAVLVVHHPGKEAGKGMRGHSSLRGALDTEIEAKEVGERLVTLVCQKQKDAQEFLPVRLGLKVVTFADEQGQAFSSSCAVDKAARTTDEDDPRREEAREVFVRSFVRSGCTAATLRDALQETLEVGRTKAYELINTLVSEGFLANTGSDKRPFYTLGDGTEPPA